MSVRNTIVGLFLGLAAATLQAEVPEMRVYDIDIQYRNEIHDALWSLLSPPGGPFGVVKLLPTGQLLVASDAKTHEQIARVLKDIETGAPSKTPRITLRYWVLAGIDGRPPAKLPPMLDPVVDQLQAVHGELNYEIIDSVSVTGQSGSRSEVENSRLSVSQTVWTDGSSIDAQIEFAHKDQDTRQTITGSFSMGPGEFLVLSERTLDSDRKTLLFYVVHWPGN